ncbi:hypothetical protein P167DRAFT_547022 [Morchella conica CCBAS932]|uniref:Uncharacterized protein n=1 Tax=Morchella conica CCBAS932 TaxID=1392247 RepID=A0A3N4KQQ4_9PEZI|nr:hypothetical protein P167DRAFT_547022 [Morchella conica CCBAS932]
MSNRRHHHTEDRHDSHRRSSSRHRTPPRVVFAQHQHPRHRPNQVDPVDSLAFRNALLRACARFKDILDRVQKEGVWPDAQRYNSVVERVTYYALKLSADDCREELKKEDTQKAMMWSKHLLQMNELLRHQSHERRNMRNRYNHRGHEGQGEGSSGNWADNGWTRVQGYQGDTPHVRLVKVETMPEGFIPPGY